MTNTMTIKLILISLIIALALFLLFWFFRQPGVNPVPVLYEQNVVTATGVNWETGELVTINPYYGSEVQPCAVKTEDLFISGNYDFPGDSKKTNKLNSHNNFGCDPNNIAKILNLNNNNSVASLKEIIKLAEKPIQGYVQVDDEKKDARFFITVTALYKGSHCATTYSSGSSRRYCRNHHQECLDMEAAGFKCAP